MFDVAALEALGRLKKPRYTPHHLVYSRIYYHACIKPELDRELALQPNLARKDRIALQNSLAQGLYSKETDVIRAEVENEREAQYQSQVKVWTQRRDALEATESAKA